MPSRKHRCAADCAALKRNYRRGSPGQMYSPRQIAYGLRLLRLRKSCILKFGYVPRSLTYRKIAVLVGVHSPTTIMRWNHLDMSQGAIQHRRQLKAPPRLFTDKEEQILAGWCLYKDLVSESSTSTSFRAFAMTHFGRAIKPSYMSKFMRRHRLSLKLVGNAKRSERDESTVSMALSYLEKVRFLTSKCGVDHSRIVVMDKTYIHSAPFHKYQRHIGPRGASKSRKITPDLGTVHEVWTTLSGDGSKGPFYVRTKDPRLASSTVFANSSDAYLSYVPVIRDSNNRDMAPAERGMLAYLFYMVYVAGYLKRGDVLLFDGEASFRTPGVKQLMAECGIVPLVIEPPCLHQLLSPADNHFHSILKLSYYRLLSNQNLSSISEEEKLKLVHECYNAIDDVSVTSMFRKCGLLLSADDDPGLLCASLCLRELERLESRQNIDEIYCLSLLGAARRTINLVVLA